jgi:hypothetical protein
MSVDFCRAQNEILTAVIFGAHWDGQVHSLGGSYHIAGRQEVAQEFVFGVPCGRCGIAVIRPWLEGCDWPSADNAAPNTDFKLSE